MVIRCAERVIGCGSWRLVACVTSPRVPDDAISGTLGPRLSYLRVFLLRNGVGLGVRFHVWQHSSLWFRTDIVIWKRKMHFSYNARFQRRMLRLGPCCLHQGCIELRDGTLDFA